MDIHHRLGPLGRTIALAGGVVFVVSLGTGIAAYSLRFGQVVGPWTTTGGLRPVVENVALFTIFALHHSLFARTGAKAWVASVLPPSLERSLYVWIASGLFILVCGLWQPVPGLAWRVSPGWRLPLLAIQVFGVLMSLAGSRRLDVLDLAGVRQAFGQQASRPGLAGTGLYALVRHPIYLAWILMVWPTPLMTGTRLTFAAVSTAYLVLAVPFEERALRRTFGADYDAYALRVRWRMVPFLY